MLILLGLTAAGCDEDRAFYILQNQVPGDGCLVTDSETEYRSQGLLDVSLGVGYTMFPLVRNDLQAKKRAGSTADRPEPNMLHLREYEVHLDVGGLGTPLPSELVNFTRPTSGVLLPGGRRSSAIEIIPGELVKKLSVGPAARPTIIAEIVAVAETGDAERLESLPFYYPVSLCSGCLVETLESCPDQAALSQYPSQPCGLPQDGPLVCCKDDAVGFHCIAGTAGE